jgi:membrane-associated phospholipid phosphatase
MSGIGERAQDALKAVEKADLEVTRAVAGVRHEPFVIQAGNASEIGDQPPLVALSASIVAAGLWRRDRKLARAGARMLAAHLLATAIKTAIKRSIDRTRPDFAMIDGYRMAPGDSRTHELSSMPSGHTAGAVAVAEALAREYDELAVPARLLAASIAIVQVPRCKHYASDVLVGAAIGLAAEAVVSNAIDRIERGG